MSGGRSIREVEDLAVTILWSPIPLITWVLPFVGHLGIADSRGVASDFQAPYQVGDSGRMLFGNPTRALRIDLDKYPGEIYGEEKKNIFLCLFSVIATYIVCDSNRR